MVNVSSPRWMMSAFSPSISVTSNCIKTPIARLAHAERSEASSVRLRQAVDLAQAERASSAPIEPRILRFAQDGLRSLRIAQELRSRAWRMLSEAKHLRFDSDRLSISRKVNEQARRRSSRGSFASLRMVCVHFELHKNSDRALGAC